MATTSTSTNSTNSDDKPQYRYVSGHLYLYDKQAHAYVHCWYSPQDNSKAKAVRSFESCPEETDTLETVVFGGR